jgi:hypothetical protein
MLIGNDQRHSIKNGDGTRRYRYHHTSILLFSTINTLFFRQAGIIIFSLLFLGEMCSTNRKRVERLKERERERRS